MKYRSLGYGTLLYAVVLALMPTLSGHAGKVSYSEIWMEDDGVHHQLRLSAAELGAALPAIDLDRDGSISESEAREGERVLLAYLSRKIEVTRSGERLPLRLYGMRFSLEEVTDQGMEQYIELNLRYPSSVVIEELQIRIRLLEDVDSRHDNFAKITLGGHTRPFVFTPRNRFTWEAASASSEAYAASASSTSSWVITLQQFTIHGFEHILGGYDHLLFLLGLLLVAHSLGMTLRIVTAFTVGHSISLALAALQVVTLPRGLLECCIALTIMWVAIENILSWFPFQRWAISLAFGLIHGLAFAETLEILDLPLFDRILALFAFNLGIELAQVLVVLVAIPMVLFLSTKSWGTQAVRYTSMAILLLATMWLTQRALPLLSR